MPVSLGSYYLRFFRLLIKDAIRLARGHMIGVLLAFAILMLQIHYGIIPHALTVKAFLSIAWPYLALAVLFLVLSTVRTPVFLDRKREEEIERQAQQNTSENELKTSEITLLRENAKAEADRQSKKFSFWLEAQRSEPSRQHHFKYSEHGEEKTMLATIPFFRLLVLNEGTVPLHLSGYELWLGDDQSNAVKNNSGPVALPGSRPAIFEASTEILEAISLRPPFDWLKVQGNHAISFAVEYEDNGEAKRSTPKEQYIRISSPGGKRLEGEVSSFPFVG